MSDLGPTDQLGTTGVWSAALRYGDAAAARESAAELESLGYGALWIPDVGGDLFGAIENLLSATLTATVATGILNLWMHEPEETAARYQEFVSSFGERLMLGIGVSHAPLANMLKEGQYKKPLARTSEYLDRLDEADPPVPVRYRMLAALGPKMLELARGRTTGSHPYLVTPEHTARVRDALGTNSLVAPEQAVVLETDSERARFLARTHLAGYLNLPNYSNNWKRIGFTDDDLYDGGSNRLVDALVAWGDEEAILDRVQQHRDAGADHVCVQVLTEDLLIPATEELRRLAPALIN
ncbi:MAG: LLM class F420-dependent oxidoreductase [Microthrixaceae bacterium]